MDFADSRFFCYMQNVGVQNQVDTLSHHLSLTRKSSEMFVVENLLQFPDSVTSSIRAKRGFARHPRSLAKRVRRTRINERMRKLQEVVLNIDKVRIIITQLLIFFSPFWERHLHHTITSSSSLTIADRLMFLLITGRRISCRRSLWLLLRWERRVARGERRVGENKGLIRFEFDRMKLRERN